MTVAVTTTRTITGSRRAWRFKITSSRKYFVDAGRTRPETRLITISPKPAAKIPRRGLISASTSGSSFQSNFAFAGLPSPLFFFSWRSMRLPIRSTPGLVCLPSIPNYTLKFFSPPALLSLRRNLSRCALRLFECSLCCILDVASEPSPSCPAQARLIDSPHGQEKTSTQEEIHEETRTPKKENNPEEETRAQEEPCAPQEEVRASHARRSIQSHHLAQPSRTGPRRRWTIRRQPRPLPQGIRRFRERGRIVGRRPGVRGGSDQRRGKRPRSRSGRSDRQRSSRRRRAQRIRRPRSITITIKSPLTRNRNQRRAEYNAHTHFGAPPGPQATRS